MILILTALIFAPLSDAFSRDFFANSERYVNGAHPLSKAILKLRVTGGGSCTAFFVKNSANRALVATARHCVGYQISSACSSGKMEFKTQAGNHTGRCKSVVASGETLDMALVELEFSDWQAVSRDVGFLILSSQRPRLASRLTMLGYPGDPIAQGQFTVTTDCWIHDGRLVNPSHFSATETQARASLVNPPQNPLAARITNRFAAKHNCSVYGGNSGGPIVLQGTRVVLGMPTSYWQLAFEDRPSTLAAGMDSTADFIATYQRELTAAGVQTMRAYAN